MREEINAISEHQTREKGIQGIKHSYNISNGREIKPQNFIWHTESNPS